MKHLKLGEVLHRAEDERNVLHSMKSRKDKLVSHKLRRNCLLKHVIARKIEGRVEVMRRCGRRGKQLLDGLKESRWYWILKEEALDHVLWRPCFGRGYGIVVRRTAE
jgi:hypothetical protein